MASQKCARATHLEDGLKAGDSVHDEDHAHHSERTSPQSPQATVLQSGVQTIGECVQPDVSIAAVALKHAVNAKHVTPTLGLISEISAGNLVQSVDHVGDR